VGALLPLSPTVVHVVHQDPNHGKERVMRHREAHTERSHPGAQAPTRKRRALAERLRRVANDPAGDHPRRRGRNGSAHGRAATVRPQLLEIADLLEDAPDPEPAAIEEIGQLVGGRRSPLYNAAIHISELYAALYYIRAGLITPSAGRRPTDVPRLGILQRLRGRRAARKHAPVVSARARRMLARRLRLTASRATDRDPIRRRHDVLLHYRAAAVRTELLEIAALLEHSHDPDPDCVAALRDLLANGCDSPLFNPDVHVSELHVTLDYVRSGL
jgi:hypothetical protein